MSFLCMARILGPLGQYGNGIVLQSFVLALCVLMFMLHRKSSSHDSCQTDKAKHALHSICFLSVDLTIGLMSWFSEVIVNILTIVATDWVLLASLQKVDHKFDFEIVLHPSQEPNGEDTSWTYVTQDQKVYNAI